MSDFPAGEPARVIVLDSNAFDELTAFDWRIAFLVELMDEGEILLVTNQAVREELLATGDDLKRHKMLRLELDLHPLPFTLGTSTLGGPDVLASEGEAAAISAVETHPKHRTDALILGLAVRHGAPLVTSDRRLRNKATAQGVEVLHAWELLAKWDLR